LELSKQRIREPKKPLEPNMEHTPQTELKTKRQKEPP
jgi:hypothetical protein